MLQRGINAPARKRFRVLPEDALSSKTISLVSSWFATIFPRQPGDPNRTTVRWARSPQKLGEVRVVYAG